MSSAHHSGKRKVQESTRVSSSGDRQAKVAALKAARKAGRPNTQQNDAGPARESSRASGAAHQEGKMAGEVRMRMRI
jgi:hypothetical protein